MKKLEITKENASLFITENVAAFFLLVKNYYENPQFLYHELLKEIYPELAGHKLLEKWTELKSKFNNYKTSRKNIEMPVTWLVNDKKCYFGDVFIALFLYFDGTIYYMEKKTAVNDTRNPVPAFQKFAAEVARQKTELLNKFEE